jgi:hypothetical protein
MAPFGVGTGKRARQAAPVSVGNAGDSGVGYVRNGHGRVRRTGPDTGRFARGSLDSTLATGCRPEPAAGMPVACPGWCRW